MCKWCCHLEFVRQLAVCVFVQTQWSAVNLAKEECPKKSMTNVKEGGIVVVLAAHKVGHLRAVGTVSPLQGGKRKDRYFFNSSKVSDHK